ncbi:hypothetical protein LCGC14_1612960 [marine sediment metagenome]|uniref:Uncharacterized protein n=1 Tax=marine sediment metagenome TaxID=412755 RepID=A0A0F9KNG7_9ZZZZ
MFCIVAVETKKLEVPFGPSMPLQPKCQVGTTGYFLPLSMLSSAALDVVYGEKGRSVLPTAYALTSVHFEHLYSHFIPALLLRHALQSVYLEAVFFPVPPDRSFELLSMFSIISFAILLVSALLFANSSHPYTIPMEVLSCQIRR